MDNRREVREFLGSRRARISPEQAGVLRYGQRRRVPGLRREEVAQLAGVSVDYYTRLEKGDLSGASESVLHAIAEALRMDEAERAHLFDLAHAARSGAREPRRRSQPALRPSLQRILDSMTTTPAFIRNGRLDVLAANTLGRALYAPVFADPTLSGNLARFCFLHPRATAFYPDWDDAANTTVAILRTEAGRDPYDRQLSDLVGELSIRSDAFRTRWAAHDVRLHRTGTKHFDHPDVGDLELAFDALELPGQTGLTLTAYTAEPGSPSEDKLTLLASWSATERSREDASGTGSQARANGAEGR